MRQPSTPIGKSTERFHGLDLARAVLMMLGINYHVALIYQPGDSWRVSSNQESSLFYYLQSFIHDFRMEAFYLLSGFFFVLIVQKYGYRRAILNRLLRLGVPLVVVGATLNTLANEWSGSMRAALGITYVLAGQWLGHLWFIANLIVYCLIALPLVRYFLDHGIPQEPRTHVTAFYLRILAVSVASALLVTAGLRTFSGTVLFVTFDSLYRYALYFWLGMWMWRYRSFVLDLLDLRHCMAFVAVYFVLRYAIAALNVEATSWTIAHTVLQIGSSFAALGVIAGLNTMGRRSEVVNRIVDASYTIYLLHEPLIVALFRAFDWDRLNLFLAYCLLCALVFTICYALHATLVRRFWPLRLMLNGKP